MVSVTAFAPTPTPLPVPRRLPAAVERSVGCEEAARGAGIGRRIVRVVCERERGAATAIGIDRRPQCAGRSLTLSALALACTLALAWLTTR